MTDAVEASAYLVLKAQRNIYSSPNSETGLRPVESAKITTARQSRPKTLGKDEILIKVAIQIPGSAFDPITPSALIVVPQDLVLDRHVIEAVAAGEEEDPIED